MSGRPPGVYNLIVHGHSVVSHSWAMVMTRTAMVDVPTATLRVDRPGTGTGAVRASLSGLSCDGGANTQAVPCVATWPFGTTVTLTAQPDANQSFAG